MSSSHENHPHHECGNCGDSLYCGMEETALRIIGQQKTHGIFSKKQIFFMQDGVANGVYCIRKGMVKLYRTVGVGKQQIVRLAGAGDIIGYKAVLTGNKYSLTAEALDETEACFFDKNSFLKFLSQFPDLSKKMLESVCLEFKDEEDIIFRLSHKSVRQRVAETLLILMEKFGKKIEGTSKKEGIEIVAQLSRKDLASLSGTVLESAVRHLSDFKQSGLVETQDRKIIVLQPDELRRISRE